MRSNGVVKLTISCNGTELDDTIAIVSVTVNKAINKIPTARIVLLDGDMPNKDFPLSNKDDLKPGAEITINAGYGQTGETIFEGVVVKHSIKITGDNYARLVIECRDKAVGMTIGRKNANYVDSKDSDIITTLIGNHSDLSADVDATTTSHNELVQYYCTDWDYLLSRAEVNGLLVIVDDGTVAVKAPQTSSSPDLAVTYGEDLMEFHGDIDARTQLSAVKGTSWDMKSQAVVEGKEAGPQTLNEQGDLDSATLAGVVGPGSFRLQTAATVEKTVLDAWADSQQLKAGLARIRGSMKFQGSAKAKAGKLIEVKGVGNRFSGNAFVSAVNHYISDGNWTTEVDFGMSSDWFAERRDLVAPPASGLLPGVEGLQVGVVKKLDEDPEGQNKVQVSVPVLQADTEGIWARLANYYASDGTGSFFIPEIGDEVVLGYINNDPSQPVILGSLYSSKLKPPYSLTADNFTKAIVTKGQMKIEFDDDKKIITVTTPGENKIVVNDEDTLILLEDQNNNKVELSSGGIVLDSPKDISITAMGKITIDATGQVGISSKADVNVDGNNINGNAKIGFVAKGNASAELSASGQTTVKGAMVMIN
jgi:Rhs element Vgr protein